MSKKIKYLKKQNHTSHIPLHTSKKNGITLIALIITIVIMLILATVTIGAINGGLFEYAGKTKKDTEIVMEKEAIEKAYLLEKGNSKTGKVSQVDFQNQISNIVGKEKIQIIQNEENLVVIFLDSRNVYDVTLNGSISQSKTFVIDVPTAPVLYNTKYYDGESVAVIPKGFKVSNNSNEQTIKNGLVVIGEDESEFVWVPVDDVNSMYGTLEDGNLAGKLYSFTSTSYTPLNWEENNNVMSITNETGNREPSTVGGYYDNSSGNYLKGLNPVLLISNINELRDNLQTEFNNLINSVKKYKGFYVGRFEAYIKQANNVEDILIKSVRNYSAYTGSWYVMYSRPQLYNTDSVRGQMIWGCQYDQMLIWMQKNNIDVTSTTPTTGVTRNTTTTTGKAETDKLNNIYDLLGGRAEWTAEVAVGGSDILGRVVRGKNNIPSSRVSDNMSNSDKGYGTRMTLYIK